MTAARESGHRIGDIEVLRAVAVGMVVIEHLQFNLLPWPTRLTRVEQYWHGASGVDLFFAISGFVIARNLWPLLKDCPTSLNYLAATMTFWLRRFWRLQPSAWLWILVPVGLGVMSNKSGAFHTLNANLGGALSALLGFNNLRFGLLFGRADGGVLYPYWSLSFEEQFYLLLPVLILLLRARIVCAMLALLVWQFFLPLGPLFFAVRPGAIAVGVVLAIWSHHPGYRLAEPRFLGRGSMVRGTALLACVLAIGMLQSPILSPLVAVPYGMVALIGGAMVYAASFDRGYIMAAGRLCDLFIWTGKRSYSIYLIHAPAFAITRELFYRALPPHQAGSLGLTTLYVATALVLIVGLSELNFRFVEMPGRRYGRRLRISPLLQNA